MTIEVLDARIEDQIQRCWCWRERIQLSRELIQISRAAIEESRALLERTRQGRSLLTRGTLTVLIHEIVSFLSEYLTALELAA